MIVRWIVVSGVEEVGRNLHLLEVDRELYIVDCGVRFGTFREPGVEYIIPDFSYILENAHRLRGVFFSHAHEDHIGAFPFLLTQLGKKLDKDSRLRVFASPLTIELVKDDLGPKAELVDFVTLHPSSEIRVSDKLSVLPIHVNHSIPQSLALAFKTPEGTIIYTGDFRIDQNHPTMDTTDLRTFAFLGKRGVRLMLSDSTNADEEGFGTSEMKVRESLSRVFMEHPSSRIIISVFASHVSRIELILSLAKRYGRVVAVDGRGLIRITEIARRLGFLSGYEDVLVSLRDISNLPPKAQVILSTGTQGEPLSALTRMAFDRHRHIKVGKGDVVVISADPIPGNERAVFDVINRLIKKGAHVVYSEYLMVHASGHASAEELRLLLNLVKPDYFVPIHGEVRQLVAHKRIAVETRAVSDESKVLVPEPGDAIELLNGKVFFRKRFITPSTVLVDGDVIDISAELIDERKKLASEGMLVVIFRLDRRGKIHLFDIISKGAFWGDEGDREKIKQFLSSVAGDIAYRPDLTISQKEELIKNKLLGKISSLWRHKPQIEVRIIPPA